MACLNVVAAAVFVTMSGMISYSPLTLRIYDDYSDFVMRLKRLSTVLTVVVMVFFFLIQSWYRFFNQSIYTPRVATETVRTVILPPGAGAFYLVDQLMKDKAAHLSWLARWQAAAFVFFHPLKAGEYQVRPSVSLAQLLEAVAEGQVYLRRLVIMAGWRFEQLYRQLSAAPGLMHYLPNLSHLELMRLLGAYVDSPEGQFFPDTYFYTWGDSDIDILRQAYAKMQHTLKNLIATIPSKYSTTGDFSNQLLIIASLIEKETSCQREKAIMAGVILQRLQRSMPLQLDATVHYSLGTAEMEHLTHHLMRVQSPYNTYLHKGLPPTPIALPGLSSIKAALHPRVTNFLYFVASGNGCHDFSTTYRAHREKIARYFKHQSAKRNTLDFETLHGWILKRGLL